jgi:hypothetical protein
MTARRIRVLGALVVALIGPRAVGGDAAVGAPATIINSGCELLLAEDAEAREEMIARTELYPRPYHPELDMAYRAVVADRLAPQKLCAASASGWWAIRFEKPADQRWYERVAWRVVYLSRDGRRADRVMDNPLRSMGRETTPPALHGSATLDGSRVILPELQVGDFDGSGADQALVSAARIIPPGERDDDDDMAFWPQHFALGTVLQAVEGAIVPLPSLRGVLISSARPTADGRAWRLGTYGPFYFIAEGPKWGHWETAYPAFGPEFRLFRTGDGSFTLNDPRQVDEVRGECEWLRPRCFWENSEVQGLYEAVCASVPGAYRPSTEGRCNGLSRGIDYSKEPDVHRALKRLKKARRLVGGLPKLPSENSR